MAGNSTKMRTQTDKFLKLSVFKVDVESDAS